MILAIGLTLGGIAALMSPSRAFADTPTSTSGTACVVTAASATSGSAVATSASADGVSSTQSQSTSQSQSPSPQSDLAFTGTELAVAAAVGLLLIGAGVLLVLGSRAYRRRGAKVLGGAVLAVLIAHQALSARPASAASSCLTPPAVLPETPIGLLLPLSALLIFAAAYVWLRRRRAVT